MTGEVISCGNERVGRVVYRGRLHGRFVCAERVAVRAENFEIVVRGRLTPTLVGALDGFEVVRYAQGLTYLRGWVPDQARLHSLLGVLRDLNIELKSVSAVGSPGASSALGGDGLTQGELDG
jgi:hypothetical protein